MARRPIAPDGIERRLNVRWDKSIGRESFPRQAEGGAARRFVCSRSREGWVGAAIAPIYRLERRQAAARNGLA
jgi:hypothetical protein